MVGFYGVPIFAETHVFNAMKELTERQKRAIRRRIAALQQRGMERQARLSSGRAAVRGHADQTYRRRKETLQRQTTFGVNNGELLFLGYRIPDTERGGPAHISEAVERLFHAHAERSKGALIAQD